MKRFDSLISTALVKLHETCLPISIATFASKIIYVLIVMQKGFLYIDDLHLEWEHYIWN